MELLTVQNAAEQAGVTTRAIYYSISHGKLTPHRRYGKVLVDASELQRYRPRVHSARSVIPTQKVLTGRGFLKDSPGSVDAFIARKNDEKTLES